MGTTESILYGGGDEDPGTTTAPPVSSRSASNLVTSTSTRPPAAPRSSRKSEPSSTSLAGIGIPTRGGSHRSGAAAGSVPGQVRQLSGLILGMSQSGKQTLLQRLEGKDPFRDDGNGMDDDHSERAAAVVPYRPPREENTGTGGIGRRTQQPENDTVQLVVRVARTVVRSGGIPVDFAVLLLNPTHDKRRIRHYLHEVVPQLLQLQGYHPRPSTGSEERGEMATDSEDGDPASHDPDAPPSPPKPLALRRAVCLCLLLNFRDLKPSRGGRRHTKQSVGRSRSTSPSSTSSKSSSSSKSTSHAAGARSSSSNSSSPGSRRWLSRSTVQRWVLEELADYGGDVEPSFLVLQCGHSSLYDCFGLDLLHHFVYQSYLHAQRLELQHRLQHVQDRLHRAALLPASVITSRTAFVRATTTSAPQARRATAASAQLDPPPDRRPGRQSSSSTGRPATTETRPTARRQIVLASSATQHAPEQRTSAPMVSKETASEPIPSEAKASTPLPKSSSAVSAAVGVAGGRPAHGVTASLRGAFTPEDSRAALEAFLNDDDDDGDDDGPDRSRLPIHPRELARRPQYQPLRRTAANDDSDDDDDDFMVDHVGHRQSASPPRTSAPLNSKGEEPPHASKPLDAPPSVTTNDATQDNENDDQDDKAASHLPSQSTVPNPTERTVAAPQSIAVSAVPMDAAEPSSPAAVDNSGTQSARSVEHAEERIDSSANSHELRPEDPNAIVTSQDKDPANDENGILDPLRNVDIHPPSAAAVPTTDTHDSSRSSTPRPPSPAARVVTSPATYGVVSDRSEGDTPSRPEVAPGVPALSPAPAPVEHRAAAGAAKDDELSDDEDDFFIGADGRPGTATAVAAIFSPPPTASGSVRPALGDDNTEQPTATAATPTAAAAATVGGSGLSAAARAAIAAAQEEALRMLAGGDPKLASGESSFAGRVEKKLKKKKKEGGDAKQSSRDRKKSSKRKDAKEPE